MNGEEIMDDLYFSAVNEYTANMDGTAVSIYVRSGMKDDGIVSDEIKLRCTLHTHTYAELFACEEGVLEINTDGDTVRLYSGDIAVIPPRCRHTLNQRKGDRTQMMGFGFRINPPQGKCRGVLARLYSDFFVHDLPTVYSNRRELLGTVTELQRIRMISDPLLPVMKALLLLDALGEVNGADAHVQMEKASKTSAEGAEFDRYVVLDEIINGSYHKQLKADDISARLYLSRRQFDRIVMKRYGKSFLDVINEKRLELAKNYLRTTDLSLDDISERVGFLSKASFQRLFKAECEITPNEFRKNTDKNGKRR